MQPEHPSWALGILGMPGFTAYMGLLDIGQPKAGETLVVAAATGPVGATVGQIGKIKGCRVVGIAGGSEKCRYAVEELGFDACINHHDENFAEQLQQAVPNGIDIYYENVGVKCLMQYGHCLTLRHVYRCVVWFPSITLPSKHKGQTVYRALFPPF